MTTARQEWRANGPIALSAMIGYSMIALPALTLGLFMQPLESEFGWSRSLVTLGLTVVAVVTTPLSPVAGALADRFGARWVAVPGLALNGLAFAGLALMTGEAWLWLAAWAIFGFTQLGIRSMIWTSAVSGAFVVSRGLAIAVTMGGVAVAQVFIPPLTRWLTDDYGWRSAFAAIGLGWGGMALLVCLFFFFDLRKRGDVASQPGEQAAATPGGLTARQALRDPRLLRIACAIMLQSLIANAYMVHIVPLLGELGMSRPEAAAIAGLIGFAGFAGQMVTGSLADRTRGSWLPMLSFALPGIGYLLLWHGGGSILAISLGVLIAGYASGATMNMAAYLSSRYAGVRNFGTIFGLISAGMGLTAGVSPFLLAQIYDATGSYSAFIAISIAAAAIAALCVYRLGPYPQFDPVQPRESDTVQDDPAPA